MLGVPYGDAITKAESLAREQAQVIAKEVVEQGGPAGLETKQLVALVAYLQRLGTDINKAPPQATDGSAPVAAKGSTDASQ
jgi:cytochrome c oxidase cbb3-type subunit I/II